MCNSTGLWTTMGALCNSKEKSSQRGEYIKREAWEKIRKSLTSYVCTTQVGSFMADSRQNGLRCRIATQAVAPGLVQLMVLLSPSHTSFCESE